MAQHPSVLADRSLPAAVRCPRAGRAALREILTDPALLRILVLAAGVATLLLAVAAAL
ncbi:hypothetical protein [Actinoplanes sp. NPDC049599]|jgi:hypothetical protein|uniref:hypothetical protein n=1 Tax=Actinoplanes sp. NPDC049599 TaxID=3363903 RepID=UPI0037BC634A